MSRYKINFPYVNLPNTFTKLLASRFSTQANANMILEDYLTKNADLGALVKNICKDVNKEGFLGMIIAQVGFIGIRNRLACAFLEREQNGQYPDQVNLSLVKDILELESKVKDYSTGEDSRAFLIGFYAKMSSVSLKKINMAHQYIPLVIHQRVYELMEFSHSKTRRVDWVILTLTLLDFYLGKERVKTLLENGASYHEMINLLSEKELSEFTGNLITYASSINDSEIFLEDLAGDK